MKYVTGDKDYFRVPIKILMDKWKLLNLIIRSTFGEKVKLGSDRPQTEELLQFRSSNLIQVLSSYVISISNMLLTK